MSWYANLKLSTKFNLILSLLIIGVFLAAALLTYQRQHQLIHKVAMDNARMLARQITETREYMSSVVRGEPAQNANLIPQVVASRVAKRLTEGSPYYVRQVSLRYRNPDNKPDAYEAEKLRQFTAGQGREIAEVIKVKGQEAYRFMLAMTADTSCLECHGSYESAPPFVQERFPKGHPSYDYQVGEVIGAVSVTIPMADLYREIGYNFGVDLLYRGIIFFLIISVLGLLLRRSILNPIEAVSGAIIRVTKTGTFAERLPQKTRDEVGQLIGAYNDLMEELERKTLQSRESDERYRKFIEMARSAVVTFLEDGKIVITNQPGEELLGLSRGQLLGETIYRFLEQGEEFRAGIEAFLRDGTGGVVGEVSRQRVVAATGKVTEVEIALSASQAEQRPMFTAILREL
jgi:PAS domain S-box-containing protein